MLSFVMASLITVSSIPIAMIAETETSYAVGTSIKVDLKTSSSNYEYGGTGLTHKFTATVGGSSTPAYCLEPDVVAPSSGTKTATKLSETNKIAQIMYYCSGYPGQSKLQNWLKNNGYSSHASGTAFYCLSHVLLAYAYDSSDAFTGWNGTSPTETIDTSYQNMIKKVYAYVTTLDDPASFDSSISFNSGNASWTGSEGFKSSNIRLTGHKENYVSYRVPSDMKLHMNGTTYAGGTTVKIYGGNSFYLTTDNTDRANTTYTSPALTGNLKEYTAYRISETGKQVMAFFAVGEADSDNFTVKFGEASAALKIVKVDAETGKTIPQAGVTFDVYADNGKVVARNVTTNASGIANATGLTLGKYYVKEVKAPSGYVLSSDRIDFEVTSEDCATGTISISIKNTPQKGIINIEKYGDFINDEGKPDEELLANIKFRILAAEDIYASDTVTKIYSKGDIVEESLITDENGKVASKELPLGKYKVEEVGAFDRETGKEIPDYKYHIIDGEHFKEITLSAAAQSVKVVYGDVSIKNDGIPEITTSARDFTTGTGEGEYSESAKIIDTVSFKKLEPGKGYTLVGKLMDKATGEPILIDGKEAIGEKTFTAKEYDGNIEVEINVDSTKLSGKTVVVFETLFRGDTPVATHADIDDVKQTITYPEVQTTAKSDVTGSHMGERSEKVTITDVVGYSNLIPGKEYTVKGVLMDKTTGEPVIQNDKETTAEVTFIPETPEGSLELKYEVDSTTLSGETVVVFEKLYRNDILVGSHSDISDTEQSIYFPAITTTAMDSETKDNQGHTDKEVTIIDTVRYSNLEIGKEYTVKGVLMDKEKNAPLESDGNPITSEMTFTAENASGTIDMTFTVDSTLLEETTTVVFEKLYEDELELAVHEDINDGGQSVYWSTIKTKAKDAKTGTNEGTLSRFDKIIDTVSYTNLIPGKEYTIKGILMDKEKDRPLIIKGRTVTAEKTFIPDDSNGEVEIVFNLDSRELDEKTIVVFEDLYHNGIKITSHADISDTGQSITYPEKPTIPLIDIPKTGDNSKLLLYLVLAVAALSGVAAFSIKNKKKHSDMDENSETKKKS